MKRDRKWFCLDCQKDTGKLGEHYFVQLELWLQAVGSNKGMLCIGCLENRIGRKLVPSDFTVCYINDPKKNNMSDRLKSRIQ